MIVLIKTTYVQATNTRGAHFMVQRMDDFSKPARYPFDYAANNSAKSAAYLYICDRSPDWMPANEAGMEYVGAEADGLTSYYAVSK